MQPEDNVILLETIVAHRLLNYRKMRTKGLIMAVMSLCLGMAVTAKTRKAVFVIIDGVPAECVERLQPPTLMDIAQKGHYQRGYCGGEVGSYSETATISAIGYTNILTGTWVNKHNVRGNENIKVNYHYPTIFRIAKDQQRPVSTAIFSSWTDNRTILLGEGLQETRHLKVDYIFDGYEHDTLRFPHRDGDLHIRDIDGQVCRDAATCISQQAPDLSWIYLWYTDDAFHNHGYGTFADEAVLNVDSQLRPVWEAIQKRERENDEDWLLHVRQVLENPLMVSFETSYKKLHKSDKIFIFTPEGDLKQLPVGSTVLDFAYEVHTHVGETCNGARVNGRMVPIRHTLTNGDKVQIITSKKQSPRADWLNVVVTEKAKNKIRRYLKEQELKESEMGKGMLQRRLKNWKLPFSETIVDMLVKEFKLENSLQLYHQISTEKIDIAAVKHFLMAKLGEGTEKSEKNLTEQVESLKKEYNAEAEDSLTIGEDIGNVTYKLAKCCNPIPGDRVFGFVTNEGTLSIHRVNCPNAKGLQQRYGYRIIKVRWNGMEGEGSQVTVRIYGRDVIGLLGKITKVVSEDLQVNMKNINFNSDKEGYFEGKIVLQIADVDALEQLMDKIKAIEGIIEVVRIN